VNLSKINKELLVIAKDEKLLQELSRIGIKEHLVPHQATDADGGLQRLLNASNPVLVLVVVDNVTATKTLCELVRNTHLEHQPYIILLGHNSDKSGNLVEMLNAGADDYLVYPRDSLILPVRMSVGLRALGHQVDLLERNRALSAREQELKNVIDLGDIYLFEEDMDTHQARIIVAPKWAANEFQFPMTQSLLKKQLISPGWDDLCWMLENAEQAVEFKIVVEASDNVSYRWIEQKTVSRVFEGDREVRRVSVARDISESREREQLLSAKADELDRSNRRTQQVVQDAKIGLFSLNPYLDDIESNEIFEAMLGSVHNSLSRKKTLTSLSINLTAQSSLGLKELLMTAQQTNKGVSGDILIETKKGHSCWIRLWINPVAGARGVLLLNGSAVDVSRQYELISSKESALLKANVANIKLNDLQQQQRQMFSVIGHELRTPLAMMQMLADAQNLKSTKPHGNTLVSLIDQQLETLNDLSLIMNPDKVIPTLFVAMNMSDFLDEVQSSIQPLVDKQKFDMRIDKNPLCHKTYSLQYHPLRRVLLNLVKNALIHSEGSKVSITADIETLKRVDNPKADTSLKEAEVPEKARLTLTITDNGKGIPQDQIEKLFEAFSRGDTKAEGSGLGMMICKSIINDMGGIISYKSQESKGACFVIELDIDPVSANEENNQLLSIFGWRNQRVLLAEDNQTLLMLSTHLIESLGATLTPVSDGASALAEYERNSDYDLIITDIYMPKMSGYELVSALRKAGFTGPIVGLTAATLGSDTDKLIDLGADLIMDKPLTKAKLSAMVLSSRAS